MDLDEGLHVDVRERDSDPLKGGCEALMSGFTWKLG